jgi:hypothetical protein
MVMVFVYILVAVVYFILDHYIAACFAEAADAKGYHESKYFWLCFWLGFIGYLLVIALPDRGRGSDIFGELPQL